MKDKPTGDMFDCPDTIIPKLSEGQYDHCVNVATMMMLNYPELRLGQAFINAVWQEYKETVVFPDLFYCNDGERCVKLMTLFKKDD